MECTWGTHVDGGAPRPPPSADQAPGKTRAANSLESPLELATVSFDLCPLEPILPRDEEEDEWEQWDPWSASSKRASPPPPVPSAHFGKRHRKGKEMLDDLFKIRPKCAQCDKAGVYDEVAKQLELSKNAYKPTESTKDFWDPVEDEEQVAHFQPATPMPRKSPLTAPTKIWLASCVPEPQPEVLGWKPEVLTEVSEVGRGVLPAFFLGNSEEDFHECEEPLRPAPSVQSPIDINVCEINTVDASDGEEIEITVDSGAGEAVCNAKHFPNCPMVDSPGSLAGQKYLGPAGEEIPNEGQISTSMTLEGGREGRFTFQAAPVRKPLLAVSSVNDKGNLVIFDGENSYIIPGRNSPLVTKIRQLVQDVPGKVRLYRKNGVYTMKAWKPKPVFSRRG